MTPCIFTYWICIMYVSRKLHDRGQFWSVKSLLSKNNGHAGVKLNSSVSFIYKFSNFPICKNTFNMQERSNNTTTFLRPLVDPLVWG